MSELITPQMQICWLLLLVVLRVYQIGKYYASSPASLGLFCANMLQKRWNTVIIVTNEKCEKHFQSHTISRPGSCFAKGWIAGESQGLTETEGHYLYVVDSARSWYTHDHSPQTANGENIAAYYRNEVKEAVKDYKSVIMLGDSMGASAALMFSHLATSVIAFCPQVDLTRSSIRPGRDQQWLNSFTEELLNVRASADIAVHCGSWSHDLDQAKLLPSSKVTVVKRGVDDHRLAKELESRGQLLVIVQNQIEKALELTNQVILIKAEI